MCERSHLPQEVSEPANVLLYIYIHLTLINFSSPSIYFFFFLPLQASKVDMYEKEIIRYKERLNELEFYKARTEVSDRSQGR